MALDSTGLNYKRKINCFICGENPIEFEIYKPEHGHCGEKLDLPPCFAPYLGLFGKRFEGQFFTINEMEELGAEFIIKISNEHYHYSGCVMPPNGFGTNPGQVTFCCKDCLNKKS